MSGCTQVVIFNYAIWAAQYPELASSVSEPQAEGYFNQATLYVDNQATSIITDATVGGARETILYMVVSHIAALLASINGNAPSPLVGRISNATEGTVSVATEMPTTVSSAWFMQTKYGAMAWQAMAPYRTASYIPRPSFYGAGWPGYFGGGIWPGL
jgi:uncharacterized protein DUF4054